MLAKLLVNSYEYKHQVRYGTLSNARISATYNYQVIGDKSEFNANPSGSTLPQFTDETVTMTAGQQRQFAFPETTVDGQPVSCYWSVDGGTLQQFGAAPYFQSVKWTAPNVTTQTSFTLYSYATTAGGYASESFRNIVVNPASSAFSISASNQNLCFGTATTLTATNCSGTVQWSGTLGNGTSKTTTPIANTTYFAFCVSGGTSIKSNDVNVVVTPKPNPLNLDASTTFLQQGQSATLTAYGCSGGVVNWNNSLGTGTTKTVSPSYTTVYSASCTKNGCISDLTSITITLNTINCSVGEPNNSSATAFDLGEYNSDVTASSYGNQFCFTGGDNTDWYKIKIYNKTYYIKIFDSQGNCSSSYCDYVLEFELVAGNLLVHFGSRYTEPIYIQVYDSNATTLIVQGINSTGNVNLNVNVCSALSPPINTTRNYKCGTAGGMFITSSHHLDGTTHYINGSGIYTSDIEWFASPTSNTVLSTGYLYNALSIPVPTTFYAALRISPTCISNRTPVFVDIYPRAAAPTVTVSKSTISSGESVSLLANGCSGPVDWWWNNLGNSNPLVVSPTSTTLYQVQCVGQPCYSDNTQVTITVSNVTIPTITSSLQSICSGQSIALTATNCSGTVTWNNSLGTGTSKTVSPSQSTTYTAYCSLNGANSGNSNEISVVVNSIPQITLSADRTVVPSGETINLYASGCQGTVTWGNSLGTGASIAVTPTANTNYSATCNSNGCISPVVQISISICNALLNLSGNSTVNLREAVRIISQEPSFLNGKNIYRAEVIELNPPFTISATSQKTFETQKGGCGQ